MTIAIYAKSNITTNDIVYVFDLQYIDHAYILSLDTKIREPPTCCYQYTYISW
jgi:hypothetical protein